MASINLTSEPHSFFINGFVTGNFLSDDEIASFDAFSFIDCNSSGYLDRTSTLPPEEALRFFKKFSAMFEQQLISPFFKNFKLINFGMWDGSDIGSRKWHNDFEDGDAFNSNIIIYLETHSPEHSLQVKNGERIMTVETRAGDFVWLNQMKCFQHRAIQESGPRRILSFEYFIEGLT